MLKKKGVSEVVSIVLIIMIAVAAVAVLWVVVVPLITDNIDDGNLCFEAQNDISISVSEGYTCQDSEKGITSVKIEKGTSDIEFDSFDFHLSSGGNSVKYTVSSEIEKNQGKIFLFDTFEMGEIEEISVAPRIRVGNSVKLCDSVNIQSVEKCTLAQTFIEQYDINNPSSLSLTGAVISDALPNFKVGEKYNFYLNISDCELDDDNCSWEVLRVEEEIFPGIWSQRINSANPSEPMLPMGISFEEERNWPHLYHPLRAQPIPESKLDEGRPTNFRITLRAYVDRFLLPPTPTDYEFDLSLEP